MTVSLTKDSIDIGIVVKDADAALDFYRDTLGFVDTESMPMPGGGTMYRLLCGTTLVKLIALAAEPAASAPPGGIQGAYGYRYWTISVSNLDEITERCAAAGRTIVIAPRDIRPGVRISMVEDPDGNWVEFLEAN
jgi:catechol 2,3-dioxygenase-like lactoylglutathione lyase family enzyme